MAVSIQKLFDQNTSGSTVPRRIFKDKDGRYPLSPDGCGPDVTHGLQPFRQGVRQDGA